MLKGRINASGDLYNTEIWLDDKYQAFANSDGTFIFTNIDGGEYTLKVNINGHIIERKIVVESGVVNYFDI